MPANLENSAVATGPEKVSFHSNPKEGQNMSLLKPYKVWNFSWNMQLKEKNKINILRFDFVLGLFL